MRERSCSEVSDEELHYHKENKKIKTCANEQAFQDEFEASWDKLAAHFGRILQLRPVEALRIAEDVYHLSVKGCNRPRLLEETETLLVTFCSDFSQSLAAGAQDCAALLRDYHRAWRGFQLALEDLNAVIKVFHIQGIVKRGLLAWNSRVFCPLKARLSMALCEFSSREVASMDICNGGYDLDAGYVVSATDDSLGVGDATETSQPSVFAQYQKEFGEVFAFANSLKEIFPDDEVEGDDEDELLFGDMKIPTVNMNPSKEEGVDGFVNTSLLPSELVFEIFTFLSTEKDLLIAGQVCRRWYMLTKEKSLWQALKDRKALSKNLVRMYSKEGHEFIVGLSEACRSGTLASVLQMHTAVEAKTHTLRFTTIRTNILEKIVQYFYYKVMYTNSPSAIPDFPIESEIALEILMASNFLDC